MQPRPLAPPALAGFSSDTEFVVRLGVAFALVVAGATFLGTLVIDGARRAR